MPPPQEWRGIGAGLGERMFGKYRLLHLLGKGRYTVVWLGEHIHLKKKVAIKILFPEAIHGIGEQFRAKRRFLREARTLAQFDHPHIVQVFDSGEVDGLLYFAMEYRSEEHTSELQSHLNLVCRLLLEKKKI